MFRRLEPIKSSLIDIKRVEMLVRERFIIRENEIILVSQDPGTKPGFPPLETNIIFFKAETRYRFKIFLPIIEVGNSDLPVRWLLPSLEDIGEGGCC